MTEPTASTLRVLLIDDDPIWASLVVQWLSRARTPGFTVECADAYDTGLSLLLRESYDACVLDYRLGRDLNGLDLLREARGAGCEVPILLLTANADDELDLAALRAGAADYLDKANLTGDFAGRAIRYAVERHGALRAQRESETRYRSVFESAPYGIYRVCNEHFSAVNPALVQMLGYDSADELMTIDISRDLFAETTVFEGVFANVRKTRDLRDVEVEWRRKDGQALTVRLNVRLLSTRADEDWILEGIVEDITEKRRLAAQLRQAQKMEAVGRLAGGIAHDFNNLLTAILGYSETLHDQLTDELARHDLAEIQRAGNRAADLTRQLLAFSRKQVMTPIVCDLRTVVEGACGILRRVIGEDVEFVVKATAESVWVHADPGQIEQVLMNLVVNARDAMPQGGCVTIETSTSVIGVRRSRRYEPMPPGTYGVLSVSDTGCGMDSETRSHLFEPFFTTKPQGKGTGLGLATVYGIVKQSGGFIWADSELGAGSTFQTFLPLVSAPAVKKTAVATAPVPRSGAETILLVEDEEGVRKLACQVLRRYGYEVLPAANADEARKVFHERASDIALVVTDVVMPGMNGPALARSLTALAPTLRVLFMSGYAEQSLISETGLSAGAAFLPKPFTPDTIAHKVRDVLDQRVPPHGVATASVVGAAG